MEVLIVLLAVVAVAWVITKLSTRSAREEVPYRATAIPEYRQSAPPDEDSFCAKIHGVSFRNVDSSSRQTILRMCRPGERLVLIREPDNPVDPDAIKVCRQTGEQLGYIGAHVSGRNLAERMDGGAVVSGEIVDLTGGTRDKRTRGCNIVIHVADANKQSN